MYPLIRKPACGTLWEFTRMPGGYAMMTCRFAGLAIVVLCLVLIAPAVALENPYRHAGDVTGLDIPVPLVTDGLKSAGSSGIEFRGAGYTHRIGRVSIAMEPLNPKSDGKISVDGNLRRYTTGATVVEHEVYRDLVKERIILAAPATLRYSYDLALSDWTTVEPDESRPVKKPGPNSTTIITYPYTKEVTNYAKDSTIDISPDRWGNLVVYVNSEDVVVMPKPFATDAAGKRFEMDFKLDKKAKTITVAGDLADAKYPVVVDPTERVTNGGFETGNLSGWTNAIGNTNTYKIKSDTPYQGNYYLDVIGSGGYSGIRQTSLIDYTGTTSVSNAAAIPVRNTYDIPMSDIAISGWHWLVNAPGQNVQGWTPRSTSPGLTGSGNLVIWTYSSTHGHIDSVAVNPPLPDPPVADFTGTPLSGTAPLTVQFTDLSTNTPTFWSWSFGDGGTSPVQNPSHQYTSAGTYTISLTAANAAGSDGETKTGYVVVTEQTDFYVLAEGVGMYHGTQADLSQGNITPGDFYNYLLNNRCGTVDPEKCWNGRGLFVDDNAGSVHWSTAEQASSYADNADFALFVGHGWNNGIVFGTANSNLELERPNMVYGTNKAKWITLLSCNVLNQSTQTNWESAFNGLHILNGFDTMGLLYPYQGTKYAQMLTGTGGGYDRKPIRTAWREMLQETTQRSEIKGAYMWAYPCGNDYLPGFGEYCSAPTKNGQGEYDISWMNFECDDVP